ncbi:MAG: exodeoxyribonuclease VII small subunit [Polyangiaceae bacterium]
MTDGGKGETAKKRSTGDAKGGDVHESFEAKMKRLSEIVGSLERGDLTLEKSLELFEEGIRLSRKSQAELDLAQKKVEELLRVDDEGNATTTAFELRGDV